MSLAHVKQDPPLKEAVQALFRDALRSGDVTTHDLMEAAGYDSTQAISQIVNGESYRPIAAFAHLLKQRPEAFQAFANDLGYIASPVSAQQGHAEIHGVMACLSGALHRYMKRRADGKFCHRDRAETINDLRRLMKRAGLWLVASVRTGARA